MTRRNDAFHRYWIGLLCLLIGSGAFGVFASALAEEPAAAAPSAPQYALGFRRESRAAAEFHSVLGSRTADKKEGRGFGIAFLLPLTESNFDLGVRYVYIDEDRAPAFPEPTSAFTLLTFVFDYYVWPTKLGGLYVGGELGVTDPLANTFYSVYSDYVFVAKIGYEVSIRDSRWSGAFEARRAIRDDGPLKATRSTDHYSNSITLGARYRL